MCLKSPATQKLRSWLMSSRLKSLGLSHITKYSVGSYGEKTEVDVEVLIQLGYIFAHVTSTLVKMTEEISVGS